MFAYGKAPIPQRPRTRVWYATQPSPLQSLAMQIASELPHKIHTCYHTSSFDSKHAINTFPVNLVAS